MQDGVGDLAALKSYFLLTIKTSALVTAVVLSLVWLSGPFWGRYMDADNQQRFAYMATALIVMAGFRALTLAPTQAAIVLKKERLVMLAPVLEAFSSIIGISLCWFFKKGELIIWIFVLAVLIRVLVAGFWETGLIIRYWKSKERLS
ncbi:hypothetical protein LP414_19870 [Polaromonas sp. P1(28)-13]|nr:hypothetical protein LP414_19870 [Polaromonas sp. P1(28)-13]